MQQLSGLDAAFLYGETPAMHMHVIGLIVVDPSTMPGGYSFAKIRALLADRSEYIPAMRRRLAPVPLHLAPPYWVTDPDFDLDYHVRRIAVPSPGGDAEVAEIVGDIASRSLDRAKPLWEFWVVEGLENGHVAIIGKMHHSTVDGVTGANLLFEMFDLEPSPAPREDRPKAELLKGKPGDAALVGRAVFDLARRPFGMVKLAGETAYRMGNLLVARRRRSGPGMPTPFTAARTSFNAALTPHRKVAFVQVSLDDVKKVRKAFGCKVNDVVLAVCAGALRRYLADRDELPEDRALIASVPVGVHDETADREGTNKVSIMFSTLATDIEDPVARLRCIAESNEGAKEEHKFVGASTLQQWADYATPNMFSLAARLYSGLRLSERHPVVHNLIISNVPGPPVPLYFAGARLVALYPLGPILEGAGLNVTVLSNLDRIGFGFIACRELMPELWDLADAVPAALAELVKEAERL